MDNARGNGWSRPTGSPPISTRPASSSSTAPCTCRPAKRNAKAEYLAEHIPGALFFDIDDIADEKSPLPHMLPSSTKFASRMKKMGIGDGMHVVAYDSEGLYSAARVWWMFRAMGHEEVRVLNGGLKKWKAEGRPLEDGEPRQAHRAPLHGHAQRRARARRRRREGADRQPRRRRSSMRAPPPASKAACPSPRQACAPATSRARATCPSPRCSMPTAR